MHLGSNPPGACNKILRVGECTPGTHLEPGRYEVLLRKDGDPPTYSWFRVKDRPVEKPFELLESEW